MTTLVVVPLDIEYDLLAAALQQHGHQAEQITVGQLVALRFPTLDMLVAQGGLGKTQFGVQTQHLLDHLPAVDAVICCGAAGALAHQLAVGDLVLATEIVEHDFHRRFVIKPQPRFAGDAAMLARFRQLPLDSVPCTVHFEIITSGDEDIVARERAEHLRETTGAHAVAWEGVGGARACAFSGVPFVELRGLTDNANHDAATDFRHNLGLAMTNAALLLALWCAARLKERA